MHLIELGADERRDDSVALLCANTYGHQAGLAPLVAYTGALTQWLPKDQARVLALADSQDRLLCVAMLVLEEGGKGAELKWLTTPESLRGKGYAHELVSRLTGHMRLKVVTTEEHERWLRKAGFKRWSWRDSGQRIGFTRGTREYNATLMVDDARITQQFKADRSLFERFSARFIKGLQRFNGPV